MHKSFIKSILISFNVHANKQLVIHCGVYGSGNFNKHDIRIEKCAYNNCFKSADYSGKYLQDSMVQICGQHDSESVGAPIKLSTNINVNKLANDLNNDLSGTCAYTASCEVGK